MVSTLPPHAERNGDNGLVTVRYGQKRADTGSLLPFDLVM